MKLGLAFDFRDRVRLKPAIANDALVIDSELAPKDVEESLEVILALGWVKHFEFGNSLPCLPVPSELIEKLVLNVDETSVFETLLSALLARTEFEKSVE